MRRTIELALLFLRLGATSFGGPAAHVALMEEELVRKRSWLTSEELLDLLAATQLIPGPNSTELALHVGYRRAGFPGLFVAGICFIAPAALITSVFAWAYVRFGHVPRAASALYGVKPVIIAVVALALWNLGRSALKTRALAALGVAAVAAAAFGVDPLIVLLAGGSLAILSARAGAGAPLLAIAAAPTATAASSPSLFLIFAKIGSVLYGGGYVLLAFLRDELVSRRHWLTEAQLVDAIAIGQLTPGPLFSTATFVGYLLNGWSGALAATLGIFAPAFVFVAASGFLVPRLRRSASAGAFLDGVNVASLGLMAVVTAELANAALVDVPTVALALGSLALMLRLELSSVWLILGGGFVGLLSSSLR